MKVLVLGGDGFCGWPTALFLSKNGYEVVIIDNLSRRKIDNELGTNSLTPIESITDRIKVWQNISHKPIVLYKKDLAMDYDGFLTVLKFEQPDAIVHFAEQRAAPYSMKDSRTKRYTVNNNVNVTHNVLAAIVESELDIHLVHLGTMGVYGYAGVLPEGYIEFQGRKVLYPSDPGSVYHTTKVIDQHLFYFYNKNNGLRITDLHQGVVWGTQTEETAMDERLINRFDYDSDYGTVLNRFLMQAAIGYPLTVYGTGGQTRAFIHIRDTVKCVRLALEHPPQKGERVQIANQLTEIHTLMKLAELVSKLTGAKIKHIKNPRKEAVQNDLNAQNGTLLNWGLNPITLEQGLMGEIMDIADKYKNRCIEGVILPSSFW